MKDMIAVICSVRYIFHELTIPIVKIATTIEQLVQLFSFTSKEFRRDEQGGLQGIELRNGYGAGVEIQELSIADRSVYIRGLGPTKKIEAAYELLLEWLASLHNDRQWYESHLRHLEYGTSCSVVLDFDFTHLLSGATIHFLSGPLLEASVVGDSSIAIEPVALEVSIILLPAAESDDLLKKLGVKRFSIRVREPDDYRKRRYQVRSECDYGTHVALIEKLETTVVAKNEKC